MAIPKIIHYCWFGGNPLPQKTLKYMESWRRYCFDFEIKEWNESNFDIHCCRYVEEAYKAKKWAFVADYARFYAMYHDGGIYLETDTEIIRPIDELMKYNGFFGTEGDSMTLAMCGMIKNSPVGKAMLDYYETKSFGIGGNYDLTTVNQILCNILVSKFQFVNNNEFQILCGDIAIYPNEYFSSTDWKTGLITRNEKLFVIHYADASWWDKKPRESLMRRRKLIKYFGKNLGYKMSNIISCYEDHGFKKAFLKVLHKFYG